MLENGETLRSANWMTRRYAMALTVIAALACAAYGAFEMLIAQQENTGAVVNVSGRQRMLSQRSALFVERMLRAVSTKQYNEFSRKLRETTNLMEASHIALVEGDGRLGLPSEMSDEVRAMYFEGEWPLDKQMRMYVSALRTVLSMPYEDMRPGTQEVRYILSTAPGRLLESLDAMVFQYQLEGEGAFKRLHWLETAVVLMTLCTLMLEAGFIFRPMVKHVQSQIDHITQISEALRQARDTLEEKVIQRTRELNEAKTAAEQANLAKSKFLAAAGHDLLQPLEAMGMFMGMLRRRVEGAKGLALIEDLKAAQRSMRRLLQSILELSKLEAGVVSAKPETVSLAPILTQMEREFKPLAAEKGLTLRVLPMQAEIKTDPALFERILRNLLGNAVRYTEEGGILIGCRKRDGKIRIEVYDTGPGIPEAERSHIFEEFSQLDDPNRDRSEGIGLGLAIVERLTKLLGHEVTLRSHLGKGSKFAVSVGMG